MNRQQSGRIGLPCWISLSYELSLPFANSLSRYPMQGLELLCSLSVHRGMTYLTLSSRKPLNLMMPMSTILITRSSGGLSNNLQRILAGTRMPRWHAWSWTSHFPHARLPYGRVCKRYVSRSPRDRSTSASVQRCSRCGTSRSCPAKSVAYDTPRSYRMEHGSSVHAACKVGFDSKEITTGLWCFGRAITLFLRGEQADTIAQGGIWASHVSLSKYLRNGKGRLLSVRVDDSSPRWKKETQLAYEKENMMPQACERAKATGLGKELVRLHS